MLFARIRHAKYLCGICGDRVKMMRMVCGRICAFGFATKKAWSFPGNRKKIHRTPPRKNPIRTSFAKLFHQSTALITTRRVFLFCLGTNLVMPVVVVIMCQIGSAHHPYAQFLNNAYSHRSFPLRGLYTLRKNEYSTLAGYMHRRYR